MKPRNIKGANKDAKIYVGRSPSMRNLLFCAHTLCMSYVIKTFLLVSSSYRSKQLLCFAQGQRREQKQTTKNLVEFHNNSSLLSMFLPMPWNISNCSYLSLKYETPNLPMYIQEGKRCRQASVCLTNWRHFLCVCLLIDDKLRQNIVKVAVEPRATGEWFRSKLW